MCDCPGCWKQQRQISEDLIQTQLQANELSKKENKKVIITKETTGFKYGCFEGNDLPENTIEVIIPD